MWCSMHVESKGLQPKRKQALMRGYKFKKENTTSLPPANFWNFAEVNLKIWDAYISYKAYLKPQ